MSDVPLIMHATAVAFGRAGLLIIGKSGAGKSTLALQLMALGAGLVADDRVEITPLPEGGLRMSAPTPVSGLIEARAFGLIAAPSAPALARAVVDMDSTETQRLPDPKEIVIAGQALRLFSKVESPAFPAMLRLELRGPWDSDG